MKSRHRALPFPPSGRVHMIGEGPAPVPVGRYYYHVPFLVRRPGQPLDADRKTIYFEMPLDGAIFSTLEGMIAAELRSEAPEGPDFTVIVLAPQLLGFVSQEELDRQAAAEKETVTIQ